MNPASEPEKRAALVDALARGLSQGKAAREVGYTREHVNRLWNGGDPQLRLEVARRQAVAVSVEAQSPPVLQTVPNPDPLGAAIAEGALEAVAGLRRILAADADGETLYASDQVRAAKVILELARAPAKAAVVTARALGPGGASEITTTATMTDEQRQALAEKLFGT